MASLEPSAVVQTHKALLGSNIVRYPDAIVTPKANILESDWPRQLSVNECEKLDVNTTPIKNTLTHFHRRRQRKRLCGQGVCVGGGEHMEDWERELWKATEELRYGIVPGLIVFRLQGCQTA